MRRASLALFAALVFCSSAAAQTVTNFAGGGFPNNLPALSANLPNPQYVAVDAAGNFYISLTNDSRVMKVDTTGMLTVFAGNGTCGTSTDPVSIGDGGLASAAKLCGPFGLAVEQSTNNLYIADRSHRRVRKVDLNTGIISTAAGNGNCCTFADNIAATSAQILPRTVSVDSAGNLIITDDNNRRVRRVDASTGNITTVAGNGSFCNYNTGTMPVPCGADLTSALATGFFSLTGADVDSHGNIYVVDSSGQVVRRVDATTGDILTVAGIPGSGCTSFVNSGSATSVRLCNPSSVTFDTSDNLFVADSGWSRIRQVAPAGNLTTPFSISSPVGMDFDATGNLLLASSSSNRIFGWNGSTLVAVAGDGFFSFAGDGGPATAARLNAPQGLAVNGGGEVFINDRNNSRIRRVDTSGNVSTFLVHSQNAGLAAEPSGDILLNFGCQVRRVNGISKAVTTAVNTSGSCGFAGDGGLATAARLNSPQAVAVDAAGNIYVADTNNMRIRKAEIATGIISTVAGNGATFQPCPSCSIQGTYSGDGGDALLAGLNLPQGVAVDMAGNVYVSDTNNNRVRRVDALTGIITTVAGTGSCSSPVDGVAATASGVCFPRELAFDSSGNLFITDSSFSRVRRVDAQSGIITSVAGTTFGSPWSLAVRNGDLLVTQASAPGFVRSAPIGSGSPQISLSAASITFPDQAVNVTSAAITLTITNTATAWLFTGNITSNNTEFTRTNNCPSNIGPNESCTVSITFRPTTFGMRTATLTINDNASGSPHLVNLSGVGLAAAATRAPSSIDLGNQPVNATSAPISLTITNTGNTALNITNVFVNNFSFGGEFLLASNTCIGTPVQPGNSCVANVTMRPPTSGTHFGSVSFSSNALGGIASVSLTGTGVFSTGTLSPTPLNFGNQPINVTSGPMTATLTNSGIVPIVISSFSLSSDYQQTNDCGGNVAVNTSCTITITFRPTSAGPRNSGFFVFFSSGNANMLLQGNGIAATGMSAGNTTRTYPTNFATSVSVFSSFAALGGPAGTVKLFIDGVEQASTTIPLLTVSVSGLTYSFNVPSPPAGPHTYHFEYTPDPAAFFAASASNTATLTVNKGSQTITFPQPPTQFFGNPPLQLTATASSALAVTYSVTSGPAAVSGDMVSFTGVGTLTIRASQAGDSNWNAAPDVSRSFSVAKGNQTITFDALPGSTFGDPPLALSATASSGLPVSFSVFSGPAMISGNMLTIAGAGTVTVRASQSGNANWNAAPNVDQSFVVNKAASAISVASNLNPAIQGQAVTFTATVTSAAGTPAGSVQFFEGANLLGSGNIAGGLATFTISTLPISDVLNITAVYAGSGDHYGSTSAAIMQTIFSPDTTPPVITPNITGTLGNNGWYTSGVSLTWSVTDPETAITTQTGCGLSSVNSDTAGVTFTCSATSAGGTATESVTIKRDATPPTLSFGTPSPAPNGSGWNNTDVSIGHTANDNLSGVSAALAPSTNITGEGMNLTAQITVTDDAGNSATFATPAVNIDRTAPSINGSRTPLANGNGWNNSDVIVSFACSDALSGLAAGSPPANAMLSGEGAGQSVPGTCTDAAGNNASATVSNINIDKTGPTATGTPSRAADSNGWYNHGFNVTWSGNDALSGIASCSSTSAYAGPDTGSGSLAGSCSDMAGNSANASFTFMFDSTPPAITLTTPPAGAIYALNAGVASSYSCADGLSGVASCAGTAVNGANINTATVGGKTFTVNASDTAGNPAVVTRNYSVQYTFVGFHQPIDALPVINQAKPGRTIPVKWTLLDASGNVISDLGMFSSLLSAPIACDASPSAIVEEQLTSPGSTVLRFDATSNQFIYNWQSSSGWRGCRLLQLTLSDGTQHFAKFNFK